MTKNKVYVPKPVDCSKVVLPEGLNELTEAIARNVHDVWAEKRIEQGWSYGPERVDVLKKHPCLVDYDELPETEKEYDRETAFSTLKLIYTLGYKIEKMD